MDACFVLMGAAVEYPSVEIGPELVQSVRAALQDFLAGSPLDPHSGLVKQAGPDSCILAIGEARRPLN